MRKQKFRYNIAQCDSALLRVVGTQENATNNFYEKLALFKLKKYKWMIIFSYLFQRVFKKKTMQDRQVVKLRCLKTSNTEEKNKTVTLNSAGQNDANHQYLTFKLHQNYIEILTFQSFNIFFYLLFYIIFGLSASVWRS